MNELKEQWDNILLQFQKDFEINATIFKIWIKPIEVYSVNDNKITLCIDTDDHSIEYIKKRQLKNLTAYICDILGEDYEVELVQKKTIEKKEQDIVNPEPPNYNSKNLANNLNPNYTFDTFIVGNNNNFAYSSSVAVANTPGVAYNPLFIYGGVGLGKTHLMQAIAHYIINTRPDLKVLYVTSETFTNELIESLSAKNQNNSKFRNKYRNIDVLLIDDIQFIIGKETTQEEFFHTFNELYQDNKQIVISSDRPPKEFTTLNDRLRTRFEMGLPVDIQIPTYETKMAIINKKSDLGGYDIPNDVKDYIANNIRSSIRELEGALNKISAFSKIQSVPITIDFAKETLKDIITPNSKKEVTIDYIIDVITDYFKVSKEDILSKKRNAEIVYPRQLVMYLARKMTSDTVESIGKSLGNKDHTTVLHGINKINEKAINDDNTRKTINMLMKMINPDD